MEIVSSPSENKPAITGADLASMEGEGDSGLVCSFDIKLSPCSGPWMERTLEEIRLGVFPVDAINCRMFCLDGVSALMGVDVPAWAGVNCSCNVALGIAK